MECVEQRDADDDTARIIRHCSNLRVRYIGGRQAVALCSITEPLRDSIEMLRPGRRGDIEHTGGVPAGPGHQRPGEWMPLLRRRGSTRDGRMRTHTGAGERLHGTS